LEQNKNLDSLELLSVTGKRSGVDSNTGGKRFPRVSRKSCGKKIHESERMNEHHHENTAPKWKRKPEPTRRRQPKQKLTAYVEKEEQMKDLDSSELLSWDYALVNATRYQERRDHR
jgi:hypothetical protein